MIGSLRVLGIAAALALPLPGLGTGAPATAHRTIATDSAQTQRLFDAGLLRLYAFNIGEARDDFARAAKADPKAVMPYWGLMLVETEDINAPATPEGEKRALAALAAARKRPAAPQESALIAATAVRFTTPGSLQAKYRAFRTAIRAYVDRYPADADGAVEALDAGLLAGDPFAGTDGSLTPEGQRMAADAERAHTADPGNVGEHHFAIHFWELANRPAAALSDAQYLAGLTYEPGLSHLPHMAAHVYVRLGDLEDEIAVNRIAVANDEAYFALPGADRSGQICMHAYHDHDVSFIAYGLTTAGLDDDALAAAAAGSATVQAQTLIRMHRYADARKIVPADDHFERALLAMRTGDYAGQLAERAAYAKSADADQASLAFLDGDRARILGDQAAALAAYARAFELERAGYIGDPRHQWFAPIDEAYGAALLRAGRAAEAETLFRDELVRFPHDPWLLFGLTSARSARGIDDATASLELTRRWRGAGALTLDQLG
jgi:hypothetical protein